MPARAALATSTVASLTVAIRQTQRKRKAENELLTERDARARTAAELHSAKTKLETEKEAAVAAEDYELAQALKQEIEALQAGEHSATARQCFCDIN